MPCEMTIEEKIRAVMINRLEKKIELLKSGKNVFEAIAESDDDRPDFMTLDADGATENIRVEDGMCSECAAAYLQMKKEVLEYQASLDE